MITSRGRSARQLPICWYDDVLCRQSLGLALRLRCRRAQPVLVMVFIVHCSLGGVATMQTHIHLDRTYGSPHPVLAAVHLKIAPRSTLREL